MARYMQVIGFLGLGIVILFLAHSLVYVALSYFFPSFLTERKGLVIGILLFLGLSFLLASFLVHWEENIFTRGYYFLSGFWLGLLTNLVLLIVAGSIVLWIAGLLGWEAPLGGIGSLIFLLALLVSIGGSYNAFHPRVREITAHIPGLPEEWKGKKIVQLSDVHLGSLYQADWLRGVVDKVNAVHPEMVLITGDLFDGMDGALESLVRPLDSLSAPRGVYFITGNHETYLGVNQVFATLATTEVHVLNNQAVDVKGLEVVGLSYPERGTASGSVLRELDRLKPGYQGKPNILMFHAPMYIQEFRDAGINLQLSGHTHRGQQYPFNLITHFIFKGFDYGLYPMGDYTLYTSNGVGTWGPAMRVGNTPEIVSITLE